MGKVNKGLLVSLFAIQSLFYTPTFAQEEAPDASFNYDDLKSLIQSKQIKSVDELLAALPEDYRRGYSLMYRSGSAQFASTTAPRIILFGKDAKLMLGITGDPTRPGYQVVEAISFNEKSSQFDFHQIDFDLKASPGPAAKGAAKVLVTPHARFVENAVSCKACHTGLLRPNWEPYNLWPGAYGSARHSKQIKDYEAVEGDRFSPERTSHEVELWDHFRSGPAQTGRYQFLPGLSKATQFDLDRLMNENNAHLTGVLSHLQAKWIAAKIQAHPKFPLYQGAVLGALVEIGPAYLGRLPDFSIKKLPQYDQNYNDTISRIENYHRETLAEVMTSAERKIAPQDGINMNRVFQQDIKAARLRVVLNEMGLSAEDFAFTQRRGSFAFANPVTSTLPGVALELLKPLQLKHPSFSEQFSPGTRTTESFAPYTLVKTIYSGDHISDGYLLENLYRSEAHLESFSSQDEYRQYFKCLFTSIQEALKAGAKEKSP